jgi:PAS domain S-box-containing protein
VTEFSLPISDPEDPLRDSELKSMFSNIEGTDYPMLNEYVLLQALYNNSASSYYILNKSMNILWANSEAQKQTRKYIGREIVKGESIFNYTHPNYVEDFKERIQKVITKGVPEIYERNTSFPDGSFMWVSINIKPLLDIKGNLLAISVSGTDITEKKASQDKVKEVEQTLSVLFDSLAQTYVLFDLNRRISWFNMKALDESIELFGYQLELGASINDIVPLSSVSHLESYFDRVFMGETITYERTYPNKPGIWNQIVIGPFKDSTGDIIGVYVTSKDISELKSALQSSMYNEYKMRAIFDTSSDIHTLFSEDFKLIWANKEAVRNAALFFGEELKVGEDIGRFVGQQFKANLYENLEKVKSGIPVTYERFYPSVGGKDTWLSISMHSIQYTEDQFKKGISICIKNITDHKVYEERLTQVNNELVDQNQQLNQFSYIVSHNLRGPIASLMGLTLMLERDLKGKVQSDIIDGYKITVQRFDEIINDLTKILSQTNEADKTKSVISLDKEFSNVMDLQRGIIGQLNAEIFVDFAAPQVIGVKSFVHSIFLNLLSNSIKYRNEIGQLKINVKSSLQKDKILIEFSDNGMGINLDMYQDKLFNFYKRFHNHVEGKGLGLYLVKTQVELMGGKIEIKSKVGEGTTFYIYLPKP